MEGTAFKNLTMNDRGWIEKNGRNSSGRCLPWVGAVSFALPSELWLMTPFSDPMQKCLKVKDHGRHDAIVTSLFKNRSTQRRILTSTSPWRDVNSKYWSTIQHCCTVYEHCNSISYCRTRSEGILGLGVWLLENHQIGIYLFGYYFWADKSAFHFCRQWAICFMVWL